MCGPDSAEIMQGIAIALKAGAKKVPSPVNAAGTMPVIPDALLLTCAIFPVWQVHFDSTVGIHPTAAEVLMWFYLMSLCNGHTVVIINATDWLTCMQEWVSMRTRARR